MTPYATAHALMLYGSGTNVTPREWVDAIFPGRKPDYVAEKLKVAERGFFFFYASLDPANRKRLVDIALETYGAEVTH